MYIFMNPGGGPHSDVMISISAEWLGKRFSTLFREGSSGLQAAFAT